MSEINESIKKKLDQYPSQVGGICKSIVSFSRQKMPETAVKEHLDRLIRKSIKSKGGTT